MRRTLLSVASLVVLLTGSIGATVLVPIEFRELVTTAQTIVLGRVVDVRSEQVNDRRTVETFVTVQPDEYLKGNLGDRLTVRVPGGQFGRYRTVFVGAPTFSIGDEVVLFLKTAGPSYPFIIGLTQGMFRVVQDGASGERLVMPPAIIGKAGVDSEPIVRGDPGRRALPVAAFRDLVRQVLSEAGQGGGR